MEGNTDRNGGKYGEKTKGNTEKDRGKDGERGKKRRRTEKCHVEVYYTGYKSGLKSFSLTFYWY